MPHRAPLLASLARYARREGAGAGSAAVAMRRFVARQPRCFERDCFDDGHVTGSGLVVDAAGERALFTLHAKLGQWLQLGGHADGETDVLAVACREATEESGLAVAPLCEAPIDVDIHAVPAHGLMPPHLHYDVRFLLRTEGCAPRANAESLALRWVPLDAVGTLTQETSILRLVAKAQRWLRGA